MSAITADCSHAGQNWATFSYPRFYDIRDPRRPRLVAEALLESALPGNCPTTSKQPSTGNRDFGVHQCSPDRLADPTILACSYWNAGLRVLDIRDPAHIRELGYYNSGAAGVVGTASNVIVRTDRREIWVASDVAGFLILRFAKGVWPFQSAGACPTRNDYFFATYNESSTCRTATFSGLEAPAASDGSIKAPNSNAPIETPIATSPEGSLASTGARRQLSGVAFLLLLAAALGCRVTRSRVPSHPPPDVQH